MQKGYYESRTEIINHEIIPALGDAAQDFDVEAIADEVTIYDFDHAPARVTMIEGDEFWEIVKKYDTAAERTLTFKDHTSRGRAEERTGTLNEIREWLINEAFRWDWSLEGRQDLAGNVMVGTADTATEEEVINLAADLWDMPAKHITIK